MPEHFKQATAGFSAAEWRVLGVLACERRLGQRALETLGAEPGFVRSCLEQGWLIDAGEVRAFVPAQGAGSERAFAVAPAFRPLILRQLSGLGELETVRRLVRSSGADPARSEFLCALYAGDQDAVERALPELARRAVRGRDADFAPRMLREALAPPLGSAWLERTWGELGERLVEQVLSDALFSLEPVDVLYRSVLEKLDATASSGLRRVLAEHALLRGEVERATSLAGSLERREQLGFETAAALIAGRASDAQRLLTDYHRAHGSSGGAASVTALLALLALGRQAPEGPKLARRCLPSRRSPRPTPLSGWPQASAEPDVSRTLRALLKQLVQPETERQRLSVHQLSTPVSAWEVLLSALIVALKERDEVVRAGWARRLVAEAARTGAGGYVWFARQARHLARTLSREPLAELRELEPCRPGEILLCDWLEPEPEWRRALGVLRGFSESADHAEGAPVRRVAWYVDMTNAVPARPALEEFQRGTGWTRGRRVDLEELDALREELLPEDRAVLRALEPGALIPGGLPLELLEALVGHPRVFDGARGRLQVEIARGSPRVETRRERGHLVISLEPAGAREGLNVVVDGERRLTVYRVTPKLAKLFRLVPDGVRIPEQHEPEALGVLSQLAEHVEIRSSELGARRRTSADSTPVLRISPESGAWWVEAGVRPFGEHGRFFPPGLGRATFSVRDGDEWLEAERDFALERERLRALLSACPSLAPAFELELGADRDGAGGFSGSLGEEGLFTLLAELEASKLAIALEWQDGRPIARRGTLRAGALHGALKRNKGWYIVTGGVELDHVTSIALAELVTFPFTKSGRFVRLPSGDFVEIEARVRRALALLANVAELSPRGRPVELRIPEAAFDALRSLREAGCELEPDASTAEWLRHCERIRATEPPLPPELTVTPRAYQIEGFRWLWRAGELGLGACLADDMGLGKTLQTIALLLSRRAGGPALVIAPTSVCRNWLDELKRFAPSLRVSEYAGKDREALLAPLREAGAPDVLIASYVMLQQDASQLAGVEWNTVVLDEAQFIKNARSLRARAAFALRARFRLALTGTPIENHLGDLWSLFHFLNPTLLGPWKQYQIRYLKPIERESDGEQRARLKSLILPFVLRRLKHEVLAELPSLTVVRHRVRLNEDESLRYALLRRQIHEKLHSVHGKRQHKLQVFAEIMRLRRFCCHPRLVFPDAPPEASKLTSFLELVDELRDNGHRALVFSQFVDFLQIVRERLDERGYRYVYLDGSTPKEARHERVEAFQRGTGDLFLISLKAGGFGLNLTAADYVIHLDPWWNPAVEAQATDRAHRIGQERPVTVYRLITEETIEESILALHREKRALADALLAGSGEAPELTPELLTELLAAG